MYDVGTARRGNAPHRLLTDHGMQEPLQRVLGGRVGKDPLAHLFAVHRAGCCDEVVTEFPSHLGERRAALGGEFPRDRVGVDHRDAKPSELLGCGALAAADAASEPDHKAHSGTPKSGRRSAMARPQKSTMMPANAR